MLNIRECLEQGYNNCRKGLSKTIIHTTLAQIRNHHFSSPSLLALGFTAARANWGRRLALAISSVFKNNRVHFDIFSFLWDQRAKRPQPATLEIKKRTPGKSPTEWPERPKPLTSTSSFSSQKPIPPSRGTKQVILLLFFLS